VFAVIKIYADLKTMKKNIGGAKIATAYK